MAQLSPGVAISEVDLSIVVPQLGNATAAFAGRFTKGPSDKYTLVTNSEELIKIYGEPTNENYNDWFQAYNFLQYANKLLVSRAVNVTGTFKEVSVGEVVTKVSAVNELGKVEIDTIPGSIQVGSIVKFDPASSIEYKVSAVETDVTIAVSQEQTLVVNSAVDGTYTLNLTNSNGTLTQVSYIADVTTNGDTSDIIATNLNTSINGYDSTAITSTVIGSTITIKSVIAGNSMDNVVFIGDMTLTETVQNVVGDSYELVFDAITDFTSIAITNSPILVKNSAINAIVSAPKEGSVAKTAAELKTEAVFIANEVDYEIKESSVTTSGDDKLKFTAKSSGSEMNGMEISIGREADFATGSQTSFEGIVINDLFENKPLDAKKEIAIIIKQYGEIKESYIVSLVPGAKDFRKKSVYIEDVINKYSNLLFVKDNVSMVTMPASRLYTSATYNEDGSINVPTVNEILILSNGTDGIITSGDIANAYGSVSSNTIFGNKEDIDIDIIIANEAARGAAGALAVDRADCICFIGARFDDIVGLQSAKIVENLISEVLTGELNSGNTANSFSAFFGNYKYQYDKWNDKFRWVSIAGDTAGLRADTNSSLNTWWASAGLDRGQIKNATKLAFNPNNGQRDLLYKNKVNPVVSLPGLGNAIVWGQKTLQAKPSSFDRINVRGLFNTLERSISRMAKFYLFEFNDAFTRNRFVATITPFLQSVQSGRGIYDFYVRCDETNNTPHIIDTNQFIADIAVKPTRVAEFIQLNFIAVGTGVDFKEIFA